MPGKLRDLAAWLFRWQEKYPRLCAWVEENIASFSPFTGCPESTTNISEPDLLERLNQELKRRTHVIRVNATACSQTGCSRWHLTTRVSFGRLTSPTWRLRPKAESGGEGMTNTPPAECLDWQGKKWTPEIARGDRRQGCSPERPLHGTCRAMSHHGLRLGGSCRCADQCHHIRWTPCHDAAARLPIF